MAHLYSGVSALGYQQHGNLDRRLATASVADILYAVKAAGHSLRGGHATSAAEAGADVIVIVDQAPHRKVEAVKGYIRSAEMYRRNSFGKFGLSLI